MARKNKRHNDESFRRPNEVIYFFLGNKGGFVFRGTWERFDLEEREGYSPFLLWRGDEQITVRIIRKRVAYEVDGKIQRKLRDVMQVRMELDTPCHKERMQWWDLYNMLEDEA